MSEAWSQTPSLPAPGPDGRVLYVYGEGLPTLVCAPLRLCVIELEPGTAVITPGPHEVAAFAGDAMRICPVPLLIVPVPSRDGAGSAPAGSASGRSPAR